MAHMVNPLATPDLLHRRTALSPLPVDLLDAIFIATQSLTQAAGLLLELPQSVTAKANVILSRYWITESSVTHEFSDVSAAVLFIITKMGPIPRSPRDIATVYAYLLSPESPFMRPSKQSSPSPPDPRTYYLDEHSYHGFHTRLLRLEARILTALSFDTHVALPHGLTITYLQTLSFFGQDASTPDGVARRAIQLLNASLLSPQMLYLTHQPNALAAAAIYAAARDAGVKMPACEWWEVFDIDREELGFLVVGMRSVEGYMEKLKEDFKGFGVEGMPTRKGVETELKRRGMLDGVQRLGINAPGGDEEDEMMKMMDEKAATRTEA